MVALEQGDVLDGALPEAQTWSDGGSQHAEIPPHTRWSIKKS